MQQDSDNEESIIIITEPTPNLTSLEKNTKSNKEQETNKRNVNEPFSNWNKRVTDLHGLAI